MSSLEVIDKLMGLPMVEQAYNRSSDAYCRVKSSTPLVGSALNTAEGAVRAAITLATPLTRQLSAPISKVDQKLCHGVDALQNAVPIVKETPEEICEKAKEYMKPRVERVSYAAVSKASQIIDKTNEVLKTPCGNVAMEALDLTSKVTDQAIDYCFPLYQGEEEIHPHSNQFCEDKVYHAVHTVGTLAIKAGRKVHHAVNRHPVRSQ